jgi:hypothetical protein
MPASTVARWSGPVAAVAGILNILGLSPLPWATVTPSGQTRDLSPSDRAFGLNEFDYRWLVVIPQAGVFLGLVGLGLAHRGRLGMLSTVGYAIALVGGLLMVGGNVFEYWLLHGFHFLPPLLDGSARSTWSGVGWALANLAAPLLV